jgi:hypothetical protein
VTAHPEVGGLPDSILPFAAAFTVAPAGPFSRKPIFLLLSCRYAPAHLQFNGMRLPAEPKNWANFRVADQQGAGYGGLNRE